VLRILTLTSIFFTWFLATTVLGQENHPSRVALVIGNSAYPDAPLRNAVNDARSMSKRLSKLGFQVITAENTARDAMQKSILEFASRLEGETTGLFYYAGHGIQSRGRNYLLPVDAEVSSERALRFEAVDVQAVLEEMEFAGNRINIVILDACRNNPFERRFRGGSRGLAAIDAARGILIAYATAPGAVAADGDGDNGLYTAELLTALQVPNLKVEEVFKRVRVAVTARTGGAQVPWESSSLTGDLVFNRQASAAQGASPAAARISNHEAIFWETIQDSDNPEDFRAYLRQYPQGTFASLALIRVSALEETTRGAEVTAAIDSGDAAANTVVSPPPYTVQLRVALLPFDGWHVWGYLDNALRNTQKRVTYVIRNDSRLHLVYAQHDPRADADRFWEGSMIHKTPKRDEVFAAGREHDADIVLTYFFKRSSNRTHVEAYLFDIRNGTTTKREMTTAIGRGNTKLLTRQLLDDLFADG
jgi:uncharacterized caspase-like protein